MGDSKPQIETIKQPLRFAGQYADDEVGLFYNYFRFYDPTTGRYVENDPIDLQGGLNRYGYVGGSPLHYIDPTGEFGIVGAMVGSGLSFSTQFITNYMASDGDWRRSLRCVDYFDVALSGTLGFLGPGALDVIKNTKYMATFGRNSTGGGIIKESIDGKIFSKSYDECGNTIDYKCDELKTLEALSTIFMFIH